jgi:hypothetical protein
MDKKRSRNKRLIWADLLGGPLKDSQLFLIFFYKKEYYFFLDLGGPPRSADTLVVVTESP